MDLEGSIEITLPGHVKDNASDEDSDGSKEVICIMCQHSDDVKIYLCSKKSDNTQNCVGNFLHERCLENWIKNEETLQLKCLNCNSNTIIIPDSIKNNNSDLVNDASTNMSYIIINQYNYFNRDNHETRCCKGCCFLFVIMSSTLFLILAIKSMHY